MKTLRNIILITSLIILAAGTGFRWGESRGKQNSLTQPLLMVGTTPSSETSRLLSQNQVDFSLFWDVWDKLTKTYIDKTALDPQKMVYGAIAGMVASLDDPYTVFLTPEENKEAKDELGGRFQGIGAQLGMKEGRIVVVAPLSGTPAERAGLRPGDFIVKVNNEATTNWTLPKAVSRIRGPKGSTVTLTILHQGEEKSVDIPIVRDNIQIVSVEWKPINVKCQMSNVKCEIIQGDCPDCIGVAYLKLSRFGDNTNVEWDRAVSEIIKKNCGSFNSSCRGVVLDLRNNPGGYLQSSVYIASEFLSGGVVVIQDNSDGSRQTYTVNRKGKLLNLPLTVLINKGSASASEIVAGSLKIRGRAKLVGETTFGKGSVQDTEELASGAGLHVTVARWLLPDGTHLNGQGVDPDVMIEAFEDDEKDDLQLEKAIEVLVGDR